MPKMKFSKLVEAIQADYPSIEFTSSANTFSWRPSTRSVIFNPDDPHAAKLMLHEVGHAIKQHDSYKTDIQLLRMEREAWIEAKQLASKYDTALDEDFIEDSLDSYREWIHRKSTCPNCNSNGFQSGDGQYTCPLCQKTWSVNSGIVCRIYRKQT